MSESGLCPLAAALALVSMMSAVRPLVAEQWTFKLPKMAIYNFKTTANETGVTTRRDLYVAEIFFQQREYPDLRTFYSRFEAKDQEPIVLKMTTGGTQ